MDCKESKKLLSQYLERTLDKKGEEIMKRHLCACVNCSRAMESLDKMIEAMNKVNKNTKKILLLIAVVFIANLTLLPKDLCAEPKQDKKGIEAKSAGVADSSAKNQDAKKQQVVLTAKDSLFFDKGLEQNLVLNSKDWRKTKNDLTKLLNEFKVVDLKSANNKGAEKGLLYTFKVRYGQLSSFLSNVQQLGEMDMFSELPKPRTEAYFGPSGTINPKVLQALIPVKLLLKQ